MVAAARKQNFWKSEVFRIWMPLLPWLSLFVVFFAVPIAVFLGDAFPGGGWENSPFRPIFTESGYVRIIGRTMYVSAATTFVALVLAYPLAFFMTKVSGMWRALTFLCILVPFWTNILVRLYAWMIILGYDGVLNRLLVSSGILAQPASFLFTTNAVILGMVHVMLPFMIMPLFSIMQGIPASLLNAAATSGANVPRVFWHVFLPLSMPGVLAGCLLVFIVSMGFFITPALLGGGSDMLIAQLIEKQINSQLNWESAAALSFVILVLTLVLYVAYDWIMSKNAGNRFS